MTAVKATVRAWALWSNPPALVAFVLAVELTALVLTLTQVDATTVSRQDFIAFILVGGLGIGVAEQSRQVERQRRRYADRPHVNLSSVWTLAAALLLPPILVAGTVVLLYLHLWWRGGYRERGVDRYRLVFSASSVTLACHAASTVLQRTAASVPPDLSDHHGFAALLLTIGVYSLVNSGLIGCAIGLRESRVVLRRIFGGARENSLEYATLGLGALTAVLISTQPMLVLLQVPALLVLHHVVLLRQLEEAAATDTETGLLNATAWQTHATAHLRHAAKNAAPFGVIMIDLDHFTAVNDTYGHHVGDRILQAVAELLPRAVRPADIVARFGNEQFVVLCPNADFDQTIRIGERIRQRVRVLSIPLRPAVGPTNVINQLSVSLGVAGYPTSGVTLQELLHMAEDALYLAKDRGRDQVCTITIDPPLVAKHRAA